MTVQCRIRVLVWFGVLLAAATAGAQTPSVEKLIATRLQQLDEARVMPSEAAAWQAAEKTFGAWMSIWVDDVDEIHTRCVEQGLEVTWPPTDMPWNVREMHVRHPDGHVFRISKGIEEE